MKNNQSVTDEPVPAQQSNVEIALSRAANEYAMRGWTGVDLVDDVRMAFRAGARWRADERSAAQVAVSVPDNPARPDGLWICGGCGQEFNTELERHVHIASKSSGQHRRARMNDKTYAEAFTKALGWGFRRIAHLGPVAFERVGSWDSPAYSRFECWWHDKHRGVTFRYRAYLLVVRWAKFGG